MSDDYWFVQHNFKIGDDLVNVRGRDVAHLVKNAEEYAQAVGVLAQLKANIAGGQSLGQIVQPSPMEQVQPQAQQTQPAHPPAWAQPQQGPQLTKVCPACSSQAPWSSTKRGGMFKCPNYKGVKNLDGSWAHNGNGHLMEFTQ